MGRVKYNNNGVSRYGNSQDGTVFCLQLNSSGKLSYSDSSCTHLWCGGIQKAGVGSSDFVIGVSFEGCCYIPYHRLNSISISARDTLQTHSWSSSLPVVRSLCPSGQFSYWSGSSSTLLYVKTPLPYLQHFTSQQTLLNTCILTQHLGVQSRTKQIPYVQFPLPHICIILPHATSYYSTCYFQSLPHAHCPSLPLCFIPSVYKLWVPVLYFLSFEY